MRRLYLYLLLGLLAGCSTTGSVGYYGPPSPAVVSYSVVDNSRMLNTGVDVQAINAAINANEGPYWAPDDEVWQQSLDDDFL